jgi:hypothetical protein
MTVLPVRKCKTRRTECNLTDARKGSQPFELPTLQDVEIPAMSEQSVQKCASLP